MGQVPVTSLSGTGTQCAQIFQFFKTGQQSALCDVQFTDFLNMGNKFKFVLGKEKPHCVGQEKNMFVLELWGGRREATSFVVWG